MPKEGFGPEEVGGPITDIRASESRTRHKLSVVSERDCKCKFETVCLCQVEHL